MSFLKRRKMLWLIALILICAGAGTYYWKKNKSSAVTYREVQVKKESLDIRVISTGVVQPENRLEIKPPVAGRVELILVKEGQTIRKGDIIAWISSSERAALLDAAAAGGSAELKKWKEFYKATPVLAPINGTLIYRAFEQGQTFTTADAILVMSDRLTVKAQVDETDIALIKLEQKATITLDAYPDKKFPAHVDQIAYDAKTVNNVTTYIVDVLPEQAPEFMRSGMTANVSFLIESKPDVLLTRTEAVKRKDGKSFVLLAQKGSVPVETEIEVGATDGKKIEIVGGIGEGDILLIPQMKTDDGGKGSSPFSPFSSRKPR